MKSLNDLDATKACAAGFEFQYVPTDFTGDPDKIPEDDRVYLTVIGSQSEKVTTEVARLVNERRQKAAAREVNRKIGVGKKKAEFEPLESDVEFGQRLAAVRLVGWRGIADPCTPENALRLCQINQDVAAQVTTRSDDMGNFL